MEQSLRNRRTFGVVALIVLAALLAVITITTSATAQSSIAAPTSGVFTGTDNTGDFQTALDDAVSQAVAAGGCCDILVNYEVLETTGSVGGFLGLDDIRVKIYAKW